MKNFFPSNNLSVSGLTHNTHTAHCISQQKVTVFTDRRSPSYGPSVLLTLEQTTGAAHCSRTRIPKSTGTRVPKFNSLTLSFFFFLSFEFRSFLIWPPRATKDDTPLHWSNSPYSLLSFSCNIWTKAHRPIFQSCSDGQNKSHSLGEKNKSPSFHRTN